MITKLQVTCIFDHNLPASISHTLFRLSDLHVLQIDLRHSFQDVFDKGVTPVVDFSPVKSVYYILPE